MGERTSIQWTGATWNTHVGCHKISMGCAKCYMFRDMERYGRDPEQVVRTSPRTFDAPLRWQREVEQGKRQGQGRLVFTCSWSDWFIEEADVWRDEAWDIIRRCPDLVFQVLTKRPERIADHLPADWDAGRPNVWLGVSCEDRANADRRIPILLAVPAAVRFLSCEPLLSEIDLTPYLWPDVERYEGRPIIRHAPDCEGECEGGCHGSVPDQPSEADGIHWCVVGGESGYATGKYAARPCDVTWARSIVRQCRAAGVPCHVKQLGSALVGDVSGFTRTHFGRPWLRDSHGGDPSEWPEDLRVREWPIALENS